MRIRLGPIDWLDGYALAKAKADIRSGRQSTLWAYQGELSRSGQKA